MQGSNICIIIKASTEVGFQRMRTRILLAARLRPALGFFCQPGRHNGMAAAPKDEILRCSQDLEEWISHEPFGACCGLSQGLVTVWDTNWMAQSSERASGAFLRSQVPPTQPEALFLRVPHGLCPGSPRFPKLPYPECLKAPN